MIFHLLNLVRFIRLACSIEEKCERRAFFEYSRQSLPYGWNVTFARTHIQNAKMAAPSLHCMLHMLLLIYTNATAHVSSLFLFAANGKNVPSKHENIEVQFRNRFQSVPKWNQIQLSFQFIVCKPSIARSTWSTWNQMFWLSRRKAPQTHKCLYKYQNCLPISVIGGWLATNT